MSEKLNPSGIQVDDYMSFTYFGKVTQNTVRNQEPTLHITGIDGAPESFSVCGGALIETAKSAGFVSKESKVTKTEAALMLVQSKGDPITVCFIKQDGTERVMKGKVVAHEELLGRSRVRDFEITSGDPLRLVDHRTLKWVIHAGTKYVVKEK